MSSHVIEMAAQQGEQRVELCERIFNVMSENVYLWLSNKDQRTEATRKQLASLMMQCEVAEVFDVTGKHLSFDVNDSISLW